MPERADYPDLSSAASQPPADPLSLVKEMRKRRKSISEADLDALERLIPSGVTPPVTPEGKERYIAAARAVPVTANLFTDAGQGQASMQSRIVEALTKVG